MLGIALIVLLVCGLAGASSKVTVTFWHAMGGNSGKELQALVDEFNASHPDIELKAVNQGGYDVLMQKVMAAVVAKDPPTMAQVYNNWTAELIEAQAIVAMEKFVKDPRLGLPASDLEDFFSGFRRANSWSGTLYTLPFNKSVYVLYYNQDLLRKAGVAVPGTWGELREAAKKVAEATGVKGFVVKPDIDTFGVFLRSNGGEWLDQSGAAAFNGVPGREALQFISDMIRTDRSAYVFDGYLDEEFNKGKTAMFIASSATIPWIKGSFDWGTAPIPEGKAKATVAQGTDVAIFARVSEAEQRAAWQVVKWLTSTEITARWAASTGYVPVRNSGLSRPVMRDYVNMAPTRHRAPLDQLNVITFDPGVSTWFPVRGYVTEAVQRALLAGGDPRIALDAAAAKANAVLKR